MMLDKEDVKRITESILSELRIEVMDGDFTSPNSRTVILYHGERELSRDYFDIVQTREYEG